MNKSLIKIIILLVCFLFTLVCFYSPIIESKNLYDDSYITFRYAINLADGKGLVFNSYERLNSASSLLYTLILSIVYKLGIQNLESVALAIGLTGGVGIIIFGTLIIRKLINKHSLFEYYMLPIAVSGSIVAWSISGMETVFFTSLIVIWFYLHLTGKQRLSYVVLCLLAFTRPEAVLLLISIIIVNVFLSSYTLDFWRSLFWGGVSFVAYFLFNFLYYGNALPHPVVFKSAALYYSPGFIKSVGNMIGFIFQHSGIVFPAIAVTFVTLAAVITLRQTGHGNKFNINASVLTLKVYLALSLGSFIVGPYSDFNRYMIQILPICAILLAYVAQRFLTLPNINRSIFKFVPVLFISIATIQGIQENFMLSEFFVRTSQHQAARKEIGNWINSNLTRGDLILSSDVGAIAYIAIGHDFVDVFGLTSSMPIDAIRSQNWNLFIEHLMNSDRVWIADTQRPDGTIQALDILELPTKYFDDVTPQQTISHSDNYTIHFKIESTDGYGFIVASID